MPPRSIRYRVLRGAVVRTGGFARFKVIFLVWTSNFSRHYHLFSRFALCYNMPKILKFGKGVVMKNVILALTVGFVALAAKADIMLYWTVPTYNYDPEKGEENTSMDQAIYSYYSDPNHSTMPTTLYATIFAKSGSDGYTALDTIVLGSAVDTNITGYSSDYESYIIELYNANEKVAFSEPYTYASLLSSNPTWVTDTLGMKADVAFNFGSGNFRATPEPTSGLLMLLGLAGLALKRKRI